INRHRLELQQKVKISTIKTINDFPELSETDIILDGLFGTGLTRTLEDLAAEIVQKINDGQNKVISIDIPSGLMGEDNSENNTENIIQADFTLTFQFPKISFLFAENEKFVGEWEVLPIRLHPNGISQTETSYFFIEKEDVKSF